MTTLSVAVVSHNTREYLRACLESALADGAEEVVVADTASTDGSVEMVRTSFPSVRLLPDRGNRGFGAAANQAVAACSAPSVLLLNADTVVHRGAITALAAYLDRHPTAGVLGPRLVNVDGSLQPSCFAMASALHEFLDLSNARAMLRHVPVVRDRYLATWKHDRSRVVPWVKGAALALRKQAFDAIGGFDESYVMYSEERDLCLNMRLHGWQTHFTPDATVAHVGGASTDQNWTKWAIHALVSRVTFYERHFSRRQVARVRAVMATAMIAKSARDLVWRTFTRDPARRRKLTESLLVWRTVLAQLRRAPLAGTRA